MQSFPCLFLNGLSATLAAEHWEGVREQLRTKSWNRLFWPVDVGNYGFSRASSYAATAAAAAEMGDADILRESLQRLDATSPSTLVDGAIHREKASLWAHALELLARCGDRDGLRDYASGSTASAQPQLTSVSYPQALIVRAVLVDDMLQVTLYPGQQDALTRVEIGNLMPDRHYHTGLPDQPFLRSDAQGVGTLHIRLAGRCSLSIKPLV
jgi:hypothetical protein